MFPIDWQTPHLWAKTSKEPARAYAPLVGEHAVDVAVVGGGFTGLAAALALADAGLHVIVLEGNAIGSGASGRNNGLVIPHHSKAAPAEIGKLLGPIYGPRYNALVGAAARDAFALIRERQIRCDAIEKGWIQPAHSPDTLTRLKDLTEQWAAAGASVEWLDAEAVRQRVGSRYRGGWLARDGGHINPFALAHGLARVVEGAGATIARRLQGHGSAARWAALAAGDGSWCRRGRAGVSRHQRIDRQDLAGPGPEPHSRSRIYQAATAPLSADLRQSILPDNSAMSDTRRDIRAFHYDCDGRLVTGGTLMTWAGHPRRRAEAAIRRMLAQAFPQLGSDPVIEHYWEGVLAVIPDRLPRLMRLAPGVVFGGVYSGRGVAASLALGRRIGAWLAGRCSDAAMPLPVDALAAHPVPPCRRSGGPPYPRRPSLAGSAIPTRRDPLQGKHQPMIVEERDYTLRPGKLATFVETYRDHGLQLQLEFLGTFHGYFTTEIGELNHVVALWSFDSLDDRQARRSKMLADPRWQAYLGMVVDLLQLQTTRILSPVSFSPLR